MPWVVRLNDVEMGMPLEADEMDVLREAAELCAVKAQVLELVVMADPGVMKLAVLIGEILFEVVYMEEDETLVGENAECSEAPVHIQRDL